MNGAMSMIRRFLAGLFMALFSCLVVPATAVAAEHIPGSHYCFGSVCAASFEQACVEYWPTLGEGYYGGTLNGTVKYCYGRNAGGNLSGPSSGSIKCIATGSAPVGGSCPAYCPVGATKVLTFGVGWSATGEDDPNEGTMGIPPMSWCDGSCLFSFNEVIAVYMDEEVSANGYYEITSTSEYVGTGATCTTPSDPPENPDPEPPCGDGNCTPGDGDGDGPGDGDGGGDPGDGDGDGDDGDTPGGENPGDGAGGDGDGDGENPGDDGPGGGTGTGGDGEGEDEGSGECGIPGKPPCAVKLDETGTPTGSGAFDGVSSDGIGDALEGVKGSIQGVIDRDDNPNWTWTFQLPSGCTPLQLSGYNLSIDVCQWQGMIHDIMSMLWVAATFWFLISMFTKAGD